MLPRTSSCHSHRYNRRQLFSAIVVSLTVALLPTRAKAQQASRYHPSLAAEGLIGFGTPVGLAGGAVEVAPIRPLVLSNGIGHSFTGPQVATMLHLRASEYSALRFGAGLSTGPYLGKNGLACVGCLEGTSRFARYWSRAIWANLEVSSELYRSGKHGWRGFLGVAVLANPGDGVCNHRGADGIPLCDKERGTGVFLYVGLSLRVLWLL